MNNQQGIAGTGTRGCNLNYGRLQGVVLIPSFSHIMSDKIRAYLLEKWMKQNLLGFTSAAKNEIKKSVIQRNPYRP